MRIKDIELITENNQRVYATVYESKPEHKATVVIASALGVIRQYYKDFAIWLSNNGYRVITFDYSSMGNSSADSYKKSKANISEWAENDCKAILQKAAELAETKDIYWIGHSLGGQITALVPNINIVSKVITIACGSGYWRQNSVALKRKSWLLWFFVAPVSLSCLGYFPGKRLGMVGNLPYGVMKQWRKWCLHPQYLYGVEDVRVQRAYQKFSKPITSISFSDDELMSAQNINSLHSFFGKSPLKMTKIHPEQVNANKIGHFGFFKETFKNSLWEEYLLPELALS